MNPADAPSLPILTALNLHPLHRRQGVRVRRGEVVEALGDLGLDIIQQLPKGRLIDAYEVERLLAAADFTVPIIQRAVSQSPWAKNTSRSKSQAGLLSSEH
jgi:hypothetical protein